jgi:tripartite-type tricarboxylate transporter receptor subunit TctC
MRRILAGALALLLAGLPPATAQTFPERPLTLMVPAPPGGANDFAARLVARALGARLGQNVVVENRSGANGALAAGVVARARPDGHTLLFAYSGFVSALPALTDTPALDPALVPVALVMEAPHLFVVPRAMPAENLSAFLAMARAAPGRLNYASPGLGSVPHLATEALRAWAGIDLVHVAYRGSGPILQDLLSGRVQLYLTTPISVAGPLREGSLRALAIAAGARHPHWPEVPTAAEAGLPGFTVEAWFGIQAPAGTPAAVIDRLARDLDAVVAAPEYRRAVEEQGAVARWMGPAELGRRAEREMAEWTALARANNIRME